MKTNLYVNSVLVASQNQVSADLSSGANGSVVILNLKDGVYYELKDVGARIWNLIQQPCSIQSIKNRLIEEYKVDAEQCEVDLLALAEHLARLGLIQVK